jgi:hypothetical protein
LGWCVGDGKGFSAFFFFFSGGKEEYWAVTFYPPSFVVHKFLSPCFREREALCHLLLFCYLNFENIWKKKEVWTVWIHNANVSERTNSELMDSERFFYYKKESCKEKDFFFLLHYILNISYINYIIYKYNK